MRSVYIDPVVIAAADPARLYLEEYLSSSRLGNRNIAKSDIRNIVKYKCFHVFSS